MCDRRGCQIADQLEQAAHRASCRAAHTAAAKALTRAAELTLDQQISATRHLRAARESWLAGQAEMANRALDAAAAASSLLGCEVAKVKGAQGDATEAHRILVQAAPVMASQRPLSALRMIFRAAEDALWTGDLAGPLRAPHVASIVGAHSVGCREQRSWQSLWQHTGVEACLRSQS